MNYPSNTILSESLETAYFWDTHSTKVKYEGQTALEVYLTVAKNTPTWVAKLMSLRNQIVSKLGLKHLGSMDEFDHSTPSDHYKVGDMIGIFKLVSNSDYEVVLEDCDKHLDVRISFLIDPDGNGKNSDEAVVHATTVVHINNAFGKVYMFFVAPVHKLIVPSSLKQLAR
ncbi:DUF2867 domain-containing protein [Vibrio genomosp. F10]|uniref:DUF2867 domain-containing protein n=2 Tax=Vibrio genomosp. F10 TaxID=723171 RepID=A0A1E5BFR9_9VIBR|nr:DUF2867 domain-containing protein [Vibrio genomosp. F10]OEE34662.1 hypothetical protein A1QO_07445 [Vibrio genomosp. F10 str. ZF-129]OEE93749.1 hypothetical protein A1QM_08185 [Vibrio genomosp. F10 str. 9ZC157]OEE94465.1 hypothetical protein A1QK_16460 [Vibrio genomosp. F10 str. 9ZD137]OEF05112.1 hypothetical protein A1QI_08640 [Vibrio genomosp. F10 str. 9ZB36]